MTKDEFVLFLEKNFDPWKERLTYYDCAILEIETKFRVLDKEFSLQYDRNPIETIKTRLKSPESLAKKMIKKDLPLNLEALEENIHDIAGVRVICSFPEDIYMLADTFLKQDDITLIAKKDYIQNPKPNGYRSLHLVVEVPIFLHNEKRMMKVEVQFRTIAMDFWASLEHKLRYKKNLPQDILQELGEELKECSDVANMLDTKMQTIRNRIENK